MAHDATKNSTKTARDTEQRVINQLHLLSQLRVFIWAVNWEAQICLKANVCLWLASAFTEKTFYYLVNKEVEESTLVKEKSKLKL